ncbi:MAG TPA: hypothetical protein VM925_34110 [Labilithrix sp.]|nr:hypothetical protein [Labilithrix sp.]
MRKTLAIGVAVLLGWMARPAAAQSRGYGANRFDPAEPGGDWYTTESLDLRGTLLPRAGIVYDWAYRPLRVDAPSGGDHRVLVDQMFVHARADLVVANLVRVGLGVPAVVYQHGDPPWPGAPRAPRQEQALGDLRIASDVRLFGAYGAAIHGAVGLVVHLPTGDRDAYAGDGMVRLAPRLLVAGSLRAFDWAARLGYHYRPLERVWEGRSLGDDVTFAVSAGVKVNDRFVLGPELHGAATATGPDAFGPRSIPVELLLGARARLGNHFQAGTAIGGGVTTADGAPKMRLLAMFEYAPDVCVDKDGDGICAYEDACPEVDGIRTTDRRTNGCPADRDHDGIPDRNDHCPDEVGAPSSSPETVGCPDRDKDGVVDKADACPDVPGVHAVDAAQSGCPAPPQTPGEIPLPDSPDR